MPVSATPFNEASRVALSIYQDVIEGVRGSALIEASVRRDGNILYVQDEAIHLSGFNRIRVAGAGKASVAMAEGLENVLGHHISDGLIITKRGDAQRLNRCEVIEASHPVPDESSLVAGERMLAFARSCREDDLVLFVLSGGASSLMEALAEGLTLADLQTTTDELLRSGFDIGVMNAVRSRLSRIKAGGLARAFGAARVVPIVLSDVIGNRLATIGSGPFVTNDGVEVPPEVLDRLSSPVRAEVLTHGWCPTPPVPHYVVGSVSLAIQLAAMAARERGLRPLPIADPLTGEARQMAREVVHQATRFAKENRAEPFCMILGGETTVTVRGKGKGGRAQEMAVAGAVPLAKLSNSALLVGSTDGTDGPTEAAGGLVDPDSVTRSGLDPRKILVNNDAFRFLEASGGLIVTGPTGSNVNDICLLVRLP